MRPPFSQYCKPSYILFEERELQTRIFDQNNADENFQYFFPVRTIKFSAIDKLAPSSGSSGPPSPVASRENKDGIPRTM